ncbi:hypothetical protein [Marispirochaeta sp.]|uniref:hypothetical protein n=1 Tax=Marispirochaeta sp. TaxID=2038653 RepID=UPI0029C8567E|nr:hypothetical protein [Marispirochaeta sp.]
MPGMLDTKPEKQEEKLKILITNGQNEAFKQLCSLLNESLDKIVGNAIERGKYTQFNLSETIEYIVLLRLNGEMIRCAGLRKHMYR